MLGKLGEEARNNNSKRLICCCIMKSEERSRNDRSIIDFILINTIYWKDLINTIDKLYQLIDTKIRREFDKRSNYYLVETKKRMKKT